MIVKGIRARLAFPQLWEATTVNDDPDQRPAYSAAFLIDPEDPIVEEINKAIDAVAIEKWKNSTRPTAAQILNDLRSQDRVCLHNGDSKAQYDGYAGMYFLNARTYTKPLVIGRMREVLTVADGRPYGGCYVIASVDIWAQQHKKGGKRVNATLRGVQFDRDGDAFAGGPPANPEEFDDLGVPEDAAADSLV